MDPDDYLDELDLTKLDFDLDIRDLSRELILTVKIFDDKTFAKLSAEAAILREAIKQEMARFKKQLP
jgi:stress response protein SCP2